MNRMKNLEIILITYNRKEQLQNTFNQIFADNSPIKNLPITILDNKSTDGSSELIEKYQKIFPNIKHVIHNRNIGGNANICRAFELASKKYVWILCDDDEYNWDNWSEVEQAMAKDYDAIVVANYVNPEENDAKLIQQLTFVPAGIYKTENITSTVMTNAAFSISNMFPQLAIVCYLFNENKKFYICKNWFVKMITHGAEETYVRGLDKNVHPYNKSMLWIVGFINSIQMLKDKKLKRLIMKNAQVLNYGRFHTWFTFFDQNQLIATKPFKNVCDVFSGLTFSQKIPFFLSYLFYNLTSPFLFVDFDKEKINFRIFSFIKTHIRFKYFLR